MSDIQSSWGSSLFFNRFFTIFSTSRRSQNNEKVDYTLTSASNEVWASPSYFNGEVLKHDTTISLHQFLKSTRNSRFIVQTVFMEIPLCASHTEVGADSEKRTLLTFYFQVFLTQEQMSLNRKSLTKCFLTNVFHPRSESTVLLPREHINWNILRLIHLRIMILCDKHSWLLIYNKWITQ